MRHEPNPAFMNGDAAVTESMPLERPSSQAATLDGESEGSRPRRLMAKVVAGLERNAFVVLAVAACSALGIANVRAELGSDSWYSLLSGRLIAHHGLPHHDTLTSLTLGRTWVDQQWLAHLGLYGLWALGGWRVALLSVVVLYTAALVILAGSARAGGASPRSVAIVMVGSYLAGLTNTVYRAQIPAFVLFAIVLALLLADERRPSRRVYLVFPVLVLWANLHGSVVLGAALVTLWGTVFAVSRLRRRDRAAGWLPRAGVLLIAPWLATLVSPYALELPGYYRRVLDNPELARASSEWAASTLRGQPFFFGLLALGLVIAVLGRQALTPFGLLALIATAAMGVLAVRNITWFAFVAAAVLPAALDRVWPEKAVDRRSALNLALAGVGLLGAAAIFAAVASHPESWFAGADPGVPAAVAKTASTDPHARLFADEEYADRLLFEEPALAGRIAYDIRYELLSRAQLAGIVAFRKEQGPDWLAAARRFGLLVLSPGGDRGAIRLLERRPGTTVLYPGPGAVVLRLGGP